MLAHHPKTGQPIRILKSDASISRDNRTLLWVLPTFAPSPRWSRYSCLISDPAAIPVLCGAEPTVAVIREFSSAWSAFLTSLSPASECIVLVSRNALKAIKALSDIEVPNMLLLTELFDLYPFLGEPLTDADPLEKAVLSMAHVLRHAHVVMSAAPSAMADPGVRAQKAAWEKHVGIGIRVVPTAAKSEDVVTPCWLIQQYFKHPNGRRDREITACLERNITNPHIDHVLLLNESADVPLPEVATKSDKVVVQVVGHRLTYADVLEAAKTQVPAGAFVIFANADIWFDDTLRVLWSVPLAERRLFLALLRWDSSGDEGDEPTLFGPRADSQDAWVVARDALDFEITEDAFGIEFGKPGCDNILTVSMLRQKFLVVNPAYTIKAHHLHASNIRSYDPLEIVFRPVYMYVDPTPIQALAVDVGSAKGWPLSEHQSTWRAMTPTTSFSRHIKALQPSVGATFASMLNRTSGNAYSPEGANIWTPTPEMTAQPLYDWQQDLFVTAEGLLSNFRSLLIGPHQPWRHGWESAHVSTMTPCIHVPALLSVPPPASWTSLSDWVLQSLPHILRARHTVPDVSEAEFLVPNINSIGDFMFDCVWESKHIGTIPYIDGTQYFCNRVWSVPPVAAARVTQEDVALLRELLPRRSKSANKRTLVLCSSDGALDDLMTPGWVEEVQTCHASLLADWEVKVVPANAGHAERRAAFQAADWIVGTRKTGLTWLWMARPGTRILEFLPETDIRDDILHLAGAAECPYIVSLVRREPIEYQREHALIDVGKAIREFGFRDLLAASRSAEDLPLITLPTGKGLEGMWSHVGDTFREMVRLWSDRGYCRIQERDDTTHCWWGDVGEVLLYDRPTPRWWSQPPPHQMALFGNCGPPGPDKQRLRQSVWSFWPRSPKALEARVDSAGILGWSERPLASIFLGKVENGVQRQHRCDPSTDWSAAVELFSMPADGSAGYPYTQSEYLEKVSQTRWGLCLRGYGPKCNREIEYMALGTVPIVTEGVDMTNFLEPPREGEHFLRAATAADVRRIVTETSQATWERMSRACHAWWRKNASAEGLFRLTWARIEQCRPFLNAGVLPPYVTK